MDLEQQLREILAARDPGPGFTARVMARIVGKSRGRFILLGTFAAVAAAAAMLAVQFAGTPEPVVAEADPAPAMTVEQVALPPEEPSVATPAPAGSAAHIEASDATPEPRLEPPVLPPPVPGQIQPTEYTVLATLRHESQDPADRAPVEAFYAALLDELRRVPGLTLLTPDATGVAPEAEAEFRLTVVGLATRVLPNGTIAYRTSVHRTSQSISENLSSPASGMRWPLEVMVERNGQRIQRNAMEDIVQIGSEAALALPICTQPNLHLPERSRAVCMTPVELAAWQAESLRIHVFPPDAAIRQRLIARIGDSGSSERQRTVAMIDLINAKRDERGPGIDADSARAIARYAADVLPAQRADIWSRLRGYSHQDLIAPMVDSLHHDTSEAARLEALATLVTDHGDDPRVRAALEAVAREDRSEMVSMAARRTVHGEDEWRRHVIASLGDATRFADQRAAPLLYTSRSASTPAQQAAMAELARDDEVVEAALELARTFQCGSAIEHVTAIRQTLNMLLQARGWNATDPLTQELAKVYQQQNCGAVPMRERIDADRRELLGEPAAE